MVGDAGASCTFSASSGAKLLIGSTRKTLCMSVSSSIFTLAGNNGASSFRKFCGISSAMRELLLHSSTSDDDLGLVGLLLQPIAADVDGLPKPGHVCADDVFSKGSHSTISPPAASENSVNNVSESSSSSSSEEWLSVCLIINLCPSTRTLPSCCFRGRNKTIAPLFLPSFFFSPLFRWRYRSDVLVG